MSTSVFFSWQSDRPDVGGKELLETALQIAIAKLSEDATLDEANRQLVLDSDTHGLAGSPPIMDSIFKKIDSAALFIADLTFVGIRADKRPSPNPNVLIEYGWALKSLGHGRIIAVMNDAYGGPTSESLPFDMRHLRYPITYSCPEDADTATKKAAREALTEKLTRELRAVFLSDDFKATPSSEIPKGPFNLGIPKQGAARFRADGDAIGIAPSPFGGFQPSVSREVRLRSGPSFWLRIAPVLEQGRHWETSAIEDAGTFGQSIIRPMSDAYQSFGKLRGPDGWGVYASPIPGETDVDGIVFCFKSGELWSIDTYPAQAFTAMGRPSEIAFPEGYFTSAADRYVPFLRRLGITGPLQWEAGIEGVKGYTFQYPLHNGPRHAGPFLNDVVSARGVYDDKSARNSLAPFFETVFSEAGIKRPSVLDY
jgi:hypothetical protein